MKMRVVTVGPDGWSDWIFHGQNNFRLACCDCGLVHNFEFRFKKGLVEFRAKRNYRSTGQKRRNPKHTFKEVLT